MSTFRLGLTLAMLACSACTPLASSDSPSRGDAGSSTVGIYYPHGFAAFPVVLERDGRTAGLLQPDPGLAGASRRYFARLLEARALAVVRLRTLERGTADGQGFAAVVEPRIQQLSIREPAPEGGFAGSGVYRAEIRYEVTVRQRGKLAVLNFFGAAERRFQRALVSAARQRRSRIARLAMRDALGKIVEYLKRATVASRDTRLQGWARLG